MGKYSLTLGDSNFDYFSGHQVFLPNLELVLSSAMKVLFTPYCET